MTFIANLSREELLECLPSGGNAAEIGVHSGDFASAILERAFPEKLHLIDPWIFQDREDYARDKANVDDSTQNGRYETVLSRFAEQIEEGQVVIQREFSDAALPQFDDAYFDWVYVDAMHTRDAVLSDLRKVWPKIKPEGFVLGHDFTNHHFAREQGFGVIEAVTEFVEETDAMLLAMNMEMFPTYVLAPSASKSRLPFLERLISRADAVIEIREVVKSFRHKLFKIDEKLKAVPSF